MDVIQDNLGLWRIHPPCSWSREDAWEAQVTSHGGAEATGFHGEVGKRNREGELGMRWAPSPSRVSLTGGSPEHTTAAPGWPWPDVQEKTSRRQELLEGFVGPWTRRTAAGEGPRGQGSRTACSRVLLNPSSKRSRKEMQEPQSRGKSQKTIYSFLQMATGTIWLTNTDEQA